MGVLPHYVVALSVEIAQHGVVVDCQAGGGRRKGGGGKEEKS